MTTSPLILSLLIYFSSSLVAALSAFILSFLPINLLHDIAALEVTVIILLINSLFKDTKFFL